MLDTSQKHSRRSQRRAIRILGRCRVSLLAASANRGSGCRATQSGKPPCHGREGSQRQRHRNVAGQIHRDVPWLFGERGHVGIRSLQGTFPDGELENFPVEVRSRILRARTMAPSIEQIRARAVITSCVMGSHNPDRYIEALVNQGHDAFVTEQLKRASRRQADKLT
jgi:hypothetical protein